MVILFAVLACSGPSDTTRVRDVQIIHVGAQPAELNPGEAGVLTVTVADPSGQGVEAMAWPCTDLGEGCLEDPGAAAGWAQGVELEAEDGVVEVLASPTWEGVLASGEELPFEPFQGTWFLACRTGLCPVIGQALAGDDAALDFLRDPTAGMVDLPLDGASLVRRTVRVSQRTPDERNQNPSIERLGDEALQLSTQGEVGLSFTVLDESEGTLATDVFTSLGTLGPARVEGEEPEFTWYAGEEAGQGRIYAVVRDEEGGSALWRAEVVVE